MEHGRREGICLLIVRLAISIHAAMLSVSSVASSSVSCVGTMIWAWAGALSKAMMFGLGDRPGSE